MTNLLLSDESNDKNCYPMTGFFSKKEKKKKEKEKGHPLFLITKFMGVISSLLRPFWERGEPYSLMALT